MGIPGILKEIGKGERVALAKLAIEHLERSHRPLRIAIDAAIWNFQTQAGQGGKNPALRTLFYRLLKLLALPIDPVFVYDGKNKPLTKRGKTVSRYGSCISNETSKKLIQAFRFPHHTAPGEAEAECAMLQRNGLVDAVMSQDVDAIMFGSTLTLRDWSKEASKHNKSPTHVNVLDMPRIKSFSGLDPDGMILVALLSGGDYDEAGVSGIGSTLACEIARAGFGSDLLELVRKGDENGIQEWRERLQFELETNESGYFKVKRKAVQVPEAFPDRKILGYYLNPVVTPDDGLPVLERKWQQAWQSEIDILAMREYVADTFEWLYKPGAWKFVRVMAPALLASRLRRGAAALDIRSHNQITERRKHFVSDGIPELRVTVVPAEVVGLDLDAEEDSREYLESLAADDEGQDDAEAGNEDQGELVLSSPSKKRKTPPWLPDVPEKMWIAETIVEIGAREHLEKWQQIQEEIQNDPKKFATRNIRKQKEARKQKDAGGMPAGALLNYMTATKARSNLAEEGMKSKEQPRSPSKSSAAAQKAPRTPSKSTLSQSEFIRSPTVKESFNTSKSRHLLAVADDPSEDVMPDHEVKAKPADEPIQMITSPVQPDVDRKTPQRGMNATILQPEGIPAAVTQRRNRKRAQEVRTLPEPETIIISSDPPPTSSPGRPNRTMESYFAPYIAKSRKAKATSARALAEADLPAIPPEISTGLKSTFSGTHIRAFPRGSLPGTWKETEGEADGRSRVDLSKTTRPPRISIVDLTSS
ncbi:DNA excision repair protein ERCC-5 [Exophiala viscosa]|uniref:DNA excision repair protein ERCC-5 n=1 Tax=Exophiala viscosa TaxID=2486360 RepID=UPI00219971DE|nr:DNA excision repair protein ERCC-5 [Exophiala viscosa]